MEQHSRPSILVVCVHNSGRSQLAEAYLRRFGGELRPAGLQESSTRSPKT